MFLRCSVDRKQLIRFRSENAVFKFLQRTVDRSKITADQGGVLVPLHIVFSHALKAEYLNLFGEAQKKCTPYSKMAVILVFFVYLQISPCCLVLKLKIQKNIFPLTRQQGLICKLRKNTKMAAILELT